jgi:disulfide oxidoreductase YuzD
MQINKRVPQKGFERYDIVIRVECARDERILQEISSLDYSIPTMVVNEARVGSVGDTKISFKEVQKVIAGLQLEVYPEEGGK